MSKYELRHYGQMVADKYRFGAYREALEKSVTHDSVVVDIGSGPGFFALYACKLGAGAVYAVDPDISIELARQLAEDNGYGHKIQCLQATSLDLDLPRRRIARDGHES